jgi:hypothetical protein
MQMRICRMPNGYYLGVNVGSRWLAVSLVVLFALAACSGGAVSTPVPTSTPEPASPSPSASPSPAAGDPIVGEWVGVHDCASIVSMFHEAGLDEFTLETVYGNGLVPGVTTEAGPKDPTKPCDGAVERKHSHFFTADGAFGSKDFNGQTVDGGTYSLEGDGAIVINSMPFHYQVDGDTLTLQPDPVDISACTQKECRFYAAWVLMVALPGTTWTRGEIPAS